MKTFLVRVALFVIMGAPAEAAAQQAPAACEPQLPAGLVIRIISDAPLKAGTVAGPVVFTVDSDIALFRNSPATIPRGAKVFGRVVNSRKAGRIHGTAQYRIVFTSILTPNRCEYPLGADLLEAGRFHLQDNTVIGPGNAWRDAFLLLFPPTTIYQLIRIPARGPDLVMNEETPIAIKLKTSVALADAARPAPAPAPRANTAPATAPPQTTTPLPAQPETSRAPAPAQPAAAVTGPPCRLADEPIRSPIYYASSRVWRPLRNLTPYPVVVTINGSRIANLPPCGSELVAIPSGGFRLQAKASLPSSDGQKESPAEMELNPVGTGWDVLKVAEPAGIKPTLPGARPPQR